MLAALFYVSAVKGGSTHPCGTNFLPSHHFDIGTPKSPRREALWKWIRAGHPICEQRGPKTKYNNKINYTVSIYPFAKATHAACFNPDIGLVNYFRGCERTSELCKGANHYIDRGLNLEDYYNSHAEGDTKPFNYGASQSCFFSTEPFDSMVVNGCGPGNHGSGYPIVGNKNAYTTPDDRFLFYGQENVRPDEHKAAAKRRELYARIEPKTPPVSFNASAGPSAFIKPDELFVSDNAREGNNTEARDCEEHEQCVSNSPRANGLNKGEDLGHHRLYTFYFEGTTPTFDDEDLGLSNVARSVPTCGARMVSRISDGRGMHRGCVDTPGWVSAFDVRTIAGDETVHAPVFSAYLSKEPEGLVKKSEFELAWTALWGQADKLDISAHPLYDIDFMRKKLTAGPLPSAFFRQWCRSHAFKFAKSSIPFEPTPDPNTTKWGTTYTFPPFEGVDGGRKNSSWALLHSSDYDAFENGCRWLDGSDDARRFGEQLLNATFFGKHYDRVIDLVKNEQRLFVKNTHGKILNEPASERLYSLKGTNVTLHQLLQEVSEKTCGWFREYYCYEPHFIEKRAQDEYSEKSLFDFYGPGRHWYVFIRAGVHTGRGIQGSGFIYGNMLFISLTRLFYALSAAGAGS